MPQREMYSGFSYFQEIPSQRVDADVTGADVDTQGYDSLVFVANIAELSVITSTAYWVLRMQHTEASALGLGPSDYADCDASHVIRNFSDAFTTAAVDSVVTSGIVLSLWSDQYSNTMQLAGYRGAFRYARMVIEEKANGSTAGIGVTAVLGHPAQWPVNTPG